MRVDLLAWASSGIWGMEDVAFRTMRGVLERHAAGVKLSPEDRAAAIEAAARPGALYQAPAGVAVLRLYGAIVPRAGLVHDVSQEFTDCRAFVDRLRTALADPQVGAVVVDVDSPGGNVQGVQEAADDLLALRGGKPVVAVATGMAASAALWLFEQFENRVASPSAMLGSVGVRMEHMDVSKAMEAAGLKPTVMTWPPDGYKDEGSSYAPLTDEARAHCEKMLAETGAVFVKHLARGAGVPPATVREKWGKGRLMGAEAAVDVGMAQRIGTLQGEIDRLATRLSRRSGAKAEGASLVQSAEGEGIVSPRVDVPGSEVATQGRGALGKEDLAKLEATPWVRLKVEATADESQITHEDMAAVEAEREARDLALARLRLAGA